MQTLDINERREYPRVKVGSRTLAISQDGIGTLLDLSESGFSAQFIKNGFNPCGTWNINLANSTGNFFSHNITYMLKWATSSDGTKPLKTYPIKIGAQFINLSKFQRYQIQRYISELQNDG